MELAKVFLRDTPEEKRLFELLRSAYVEARYTDDFVVTKEDIDALMPKVELLRDVVIKNLKTLCPSALSASYFLSSVRRSCSVFR